MRSVYLLIYCAFSFFALPSLAEDISGHYYVPFSEEPGSEHYTPEGLRIVNADGTYEFRNVHSGFQEVYRGTYTKNGDQVTFHKGVYIATCPGIVNSGEGEFTVTARRTPTELILLDGGETQSLSVATPEQVKRVLNLPVCGAGA